MVMLRLMLMVERKMDSLGKWWREMQCLSYLLFKDGRAVTWSNVWKKREKIFSDTTCMWLACITAQH